MDYTAMLSQMLAGHGGVQHPSGETPNNAEKQALFTEVMKAQNGEPFTSTAPHAWRSVTPGPLQRQTSFKCYQQAVREECTSNSTNDIKTPSPCAYIEFTS